MATKQGTMHRLSIAVATLGLCLTTGVMAQVGDQAPRPAIVLPPAGAPAQPAVQQPPNVIAPVNQQAQKRRNVDFEFGVTVGATYSDNVLQRPEGTDEKGTLIQVTPFANGRFDNGRSRAQLKARAGAKQAKSAIEKQTQTTADIRANADIQVSGEFRLATDGVFTRTNDNELLNGQAIRDDEIIERYNVGISPYLAGRVGRNHFYETRYALRGIDPGEGDPRNVIHRVGLELRSDPNWASDYGWGVFADLTRTRYDNDAEYKNDAVDLVGFYRLSDTLRFGLGVNTTSIDILTNDEGENSSVGPTAYLNYAQGNRRNLGLRWADTYYGNEVSATGWLRSRRWIGGFEYQKGIEDGNAADALVLNTQDFLRPKNRVARTLAGENEDGPPWDRIEDISVLITTGNLDTPLVNQEKSILAGGYEGQRNTAVVALYRNRVSGAVPNFGGFAGGQSSAQGMKLLLGHKINPRNSLDLVVEYRDIDSPDPDEIGKATVYSLSYSNKVTRSLTTTVVVRTYKKTDTPGQGDVRENAVSLYFTYRF